MVIAVLMQNAVTAQASSPTLSSSAVERTCECATAPRYADHQAGGCARRDAARARAPGHKYLSHGQPIDRRIVYHAGAQGARSPGVPAPQDST
jgi:hypothetical protein